MFEIYIKKRLQRPLFKMIAISNHTIHYKFTKDEDIIGEQHVDDERGAIFVAARTIYGQENNVPKAVVSNDNLRGELKSLFCS